MQINGVILSVEVVMASSTAVAVFSTGANWRK
jgi:hypothetical protein